MFRSRRSPSLPRCTLGALLLGLGGIVVPLRASAATYRVAPSGDDANDGVAAPFRTIQRGVDALGPGDTLTVGAGTYVVDAPIRVANKLGTAGAPIVIQGEGLPVVSDGQYVADADSHGAVGDFRGVFSVFDSSYVTLRGFRVERSGHFGFFTEGSDHVTVEDNQTYLTKSSGIWFWQSTNVTARANDISRCCENRWQECLSVSQTDGFLVEGNLIHDSIAGNVAAGPGGGEGLDMKDGTRNGVCRYNHIYGVTQVSLYLDAWDKYVEDIDVYGNWVHDSAYGISVGAEQGGSIAGIRVHDNVVHDIGYHGLILAPIRAGSVAGVAFFNNTAVHCGFSEDRPDYANQLWGSGDWGFGVVVDAAGASGVLIRDNILWDIASSAVDDAAGVAAATNNLTGQDPLFVDLAGRDLHLTAASPAVDRGVGGPELGATDFEGWARVVGLTVDQGALEYGSSGVSGEGGLGGAPPAGGAPTLGGAPPAGGAPTLGGAPALGGAPPLGGGPSSGGAPTAGAGAADDTGGGCSCAAATHASRSSWTGLLGLIGAIVALRRVRRRRRH